MASEVRGLAQRSADAAKEIKALISTSTTQVQEGVSLVDETGRALEGIVGQVTQINEIVSDIAASATEQAAGLDQVNTAINQMDQVTQQNAAMVEESTAASHRRPCARSTRLRDRSDDGPSRSRVRFGVLDGALRRHRGGSRRGRLVSRTDR